jgi:hypothetical protein
MTTLETNGLPETTKPWKKLVISEGCVIRKVEMMFDKEDS